MTDYRDAIETVLKAMGTDPAQGLRQEQVLQLRRQYGENRLREKKKKSNLKQLDFCFFANLVKNISIVEKIFL